MQIFIPFVFSLLLPFGALARTQNSVNIHFYLLPAVALRSAGKGTALFKKQGLPCRAPSGSRELEKIN
eukprot:scaffold7446_cov21-Tisochrysis_lutea.AAC.1